MPLLLLHHGMKLLHHFLNLRSICMLMLMLELLKPLQ